MISPVLLLRPALFQPGRAAQKNPSLLLDGFQPASVTLFAVYFVASVRPAAAAPAVSLPPRTHQDPPLLLPPVLAALSAAALQQSPAVLLVLPPCAAALRLRLADAEAAGPVIGKSGQ